jgi:hypothetical protein
MKFIETHARAFLALIISSIGTVMGTLLLNPKFEYKLMNEPNAIWEIPPQK